jgi:probable HAF family extracellular repeat protein
MLRIATVLLGLVTAAVFAAVAHAGQSGAPSPSYSVTGIATDAVPSGIDAKGDVVGTITEGGEKHAFVWRGGVVERLPTLAGGISSEATGINDEGTISGWSEALISSWPGCAPACTPTLTQRAYRTDGHTLADLGGDPLAVSPVQVPTSVGYAINSSGDVAGGSLSPSGDIDPASWHGSEYRRVPVDGNGFATGIDAGGDVVGMLVFGNGAFAYLDGTTVVLPRSQGIDAGSVNTGWPSINDSAHIAYTGVSAAGASRAYLYADGQATDLGTLGGTASQAFAIGPHDDVVGASETAGDAAVHAFLWRDGKLVDLNDLVDPSSGWVLESARAVNASGQIVGVGNKGAFRLTPLVSAVTAVVAAGGSGGAPEPPTAPERHARSTSHLCPNDGHRKRPVHART